MYDFFSLMSFLGGILRIIGLFVFGIAVGWFTLFAFRYPERKWQFQIAAYLGFLLFTALTLQFASPGGSGAFVLGAGSTLLYLGTKKDQGIAGEEPDDA